MRIGMMADVYKPHISGVTNYISLNKQFLEKMGHHVFVFTFGDNEYIDEEKNVIRSMGLPLLDTGFYVSLKYNMEARRLLKTMDVVHVHHPFLSGSLALSYCRSRGIPIIFTNHTRYDLYAKTYLPLLGELVGETALEAYLQVFCRACDLVISPSVGMRDVLNGFGILENIEVVPNGVDLSAFRKPIQPIQLSELGYSKDNLILIYTGRLGPEKNLHFLLRSFAGAVQAYENIRLILVGDGPLKSDLMELAGNLKIVEKVHFTGMVQYSEVHRYLAISDAFITASVTEVHPLSVIEAMAAGLPVLGIQSPGVGDTVVDGCTGFLVGDEDIAAFTAKMVRIISDHELRKNMATQARQSAEDYSIEVTTSKMLELYERVVKQPQPEGSKGQIAVNHLLERWKLIQHGKRKTKIG